MIFKPYYYDATGCAAYLFGCGGKGVCVVVDPRQEDVADYVSFATRKGMRIAYVIDTHVQADRRSGGRALAATTGARYAMSALASVEFGFEPLQDEQKLEVGNTVIRVLHTPGHTSESICLVVSDLRREPEPWFVLTGDSLFVGAVGRPDLPGEADANAERLHGSLHEKLLTLADEVEVYPAHFAGSACGAGLSREDFVRELTQGLPAKPAGTEEIIAFNRGAPG
jgi:hydroxyacylglutathione hydrolase